MKNKKRAFTLVELLAVIVILAIILIIAVLNVMGIIKKAKDDSYKNQLSMIEKMAETYMASETLTFDENNQATFTLADMVEEKIVPSNITDPRCGKGFLPTETVFTVTKDDKNNLDYSLTLDTACDIDVTPPTINSVSETRQ